jgi:hypothetical protein
VNTPTPIPRPEWITAAAEAIEEAAWPRIGRDLGTIHRDDIVASGLRAVLPAIRADALREAADMVKMFPLGVAMFGRLREIADAIEQSAAPAVRPVEPSAVPAEGSGHPTRFWWRHDEPNPTDRTGLVCAPTPGAADKPSPCVGCGCMTTVKWRRGEPIATEGDGHPQPARGYCAVCGRRALRTPLGDLAHVVHKPDEQPDHVPTLVGPYDDESPAPRPILSLDTPEGDTDA